MRSGVLLLLGIGAILVGCAEQRASTSGHIAQSPPSIKLDSVPQPVSRPPVATPATARKEMKPEIKAGAVAFGVQPGVDPAAVVGATSAAAAVTGGSRFQPTSGNTGVYIEGATMQVAAAEPGDAATRTLELVNDVKNLPGVEWAEPVYVLRRQGGPEPAGIDEETEVQPAPATNMPTSASVPVAASATQQRKAPVDDAMFFRQWSYLDRTAAAPGGIGVVRAWNHAQNGQPVTVAVIDTGIVANHPDIDRARILPGIDVVRDKVSAGDDDGVDADATDSGDGAAAKLCGPLSRAQQDSWHGTHVAGVIGAVSNNNGVGIAGIDPNVNVVPIRVLGKCGGTTPDIADAIRWAAGFDIGVNINGQPYVNRNPAKVINLSLGGFGPCATIVQRAIDDARSRGALVVVAAGNAGVDVSEFQPANCQGVIRVAATGLDGKFVTAYSNFGSTISIGAPGGDVSGPRGKDGGIWSTVANGYDSYNGTSMAAPHVAGVVALGLSKRPDLTPDQMWDLMRQRAIRRSPKECPNGCGAGLLNANVF